MACTIGVFPPGHSSVILVKTSNKNSVNNFFIWIFYTAQELYQL